MARGVQYLNCCITQSDDIPVGKKRTGLKDFAQPNPENGSKLRGQINKKPGGRVYFVFEAVMLPEVWVPYHMVHMKMRVQRFSRTKVVSRKEILQGFPFLRRLAGTIHHDAIARAIAQDVGIGLKTVEHKAVNLYHKK